MTVEENLIATAREASDAELVEGASGVGQWSDICGAEIERRARERAAEELGGLFVGQEQLLTDAIRLRRALTELYGEADVNMRAKQPRFRRADSVLRSTDYLVGPDSPCSDKVNCTCPACAAYLEWMRADQELRDAGDAAERAAGGGRL
jgi:hypothetical protein